MNVHQGLQGQEWPYKCDWPANADDAHGIDRLLSSNRVTDETLMAVLCRSQVQVIQPYSDDVVTTLCASYRISLD
jgi:hypothetical protein